MTDQHLSGDSLALDTPDTSHSVADWERAAAGVLRKARRLSDAAPDADAWARLTTTTLDGISVSPLGTPSLVAELRTAGRPTRAGDWDIRPVFADPDVSATAADILTDLENGATSVWLQIGSHGVDVNDLATALAPVLVDIAPITLDAPADAAAAIAAFTAFVGDRKVAPGSNLGVDPVGAKMRGLDPNLNEIEHILAVSAQSATRLGCHAVVVDGTAVHDLGASDVQELGYVMAVGTTYLRALVSAGHEVAAAAGLIEFRLAATDEQFPTIAKLRAVRRLWHRVLQASGVADPAPMRLHVVTSRPMMSKYDPWVNMLRTCVASFAAGVGGADVVTVLPFDAPLGLPDAFGRRIARNTSSLLISESHVAVVADPAGGAHVVEKLTDDLALAGWAEFGVLDGVELPLALAALQTRIDAVVVERERQIAVRQRPITGLTEFPNLDEVLPERKPYAAGGLPVRSYGHTFEALRDAPIKDKIFLATMGTVAAHTARATFAGNLFAAGGIGVINEGRHDDVAAVLAHYRGEKVVALTGTDTAYAEWGAALVQALRKAGAEWIIVAGKPLEGADDNCAMGVDALDFLNRTREKLA